MVSREMREMSPMDFTQRFGEFPSREGLTILVVSERFDMHMMCTNAVCGGVGRMLSIIVLFIINSFVLI